MSYSVPLPFICTILHATALSDGSTSSTAVIRSIQSGASTTSVLTSATASVPAASIPRLAANAKPVLLPSSMILIGRSERRASSSESSTEPLSTITTSAAGRVWAASDPRHCASQRRPFQFGTTTATSIRRGMRRESIPAWDVYGGAA